MWRIYNHVQSTTCPQIGRSVTRRLDAIGHNRHPAPHLIATTNGNGSPHQDLVECLAPVSKQQAATQKP
jgi:hypothetical protein